MFHTTCPERHLTLRAAGREPRGPSRRQPSTAAARLDADCPAPDPADDRMGHHQPRQVGLGRPRRRADEVVRDAAGVVGAPRSADDDAGRRHRERQHLAGGDADRAAAEQRRAEGPTTARRARRPTPCRTSCTLASRTRLVRKREHGRCAAPSQGSAGSPAPSRRRCSPAASRQTRAPQFDRKPPAVAGDGLARATPSAARRGRNASQFVIAGAPGPGPQWHEPRGA